MDEDKLDQQEQKNYSRRSRKDQQGRDYVCGCGKSYLSYPALYTHIKTKHDGQKPEGTLKVTPTITVNKKVSGNGGQNGSAGGGVGGGGQPPLAQSTKNNNGPTNALQASPSKTSSKAQPDFAIHHPVHRSRIPMLILHQAEQLTTYSDFPLISYLSELNENVAGFTPPDNRIKPGKLGQPIYERYEQFVSECKEKEKEQSFGNNANVNVKMEKLGHKTQLMYAMIVYLLGAGRFVSEEIMEYYWEFCRLFQECFTDHGQQVYEVCFKPKQQQQQKQREQYHRQRERERQRDDPYKDYQYSYPPSSSKSKSYNQANQSHAPTPPPPSLTINPSHCKHSPIICDFFARIFVPAHNATRKESYKSVIQLICADFCEWMYRGKMTVVDVGLSGRYEVKGKEEIREELEARFMDKIARKNDGGRKSGKAIPSGKQKSRRKQRSKAGKKKQQAYSSNSNPNPSSLQQQPLPPQELLANPDQNSRSQQFPHNGSNEHSHDEDSYKIGHEIPHEMAGRDRSESLHQFGGGHGEGEEEDRNGGGGHGHAHGHGHGHNIDEEEIQQYINP